MKNWSFEFECPSKFFLFGEYAVLSEGSAVVLATEPTFKARVLGGLGTNSQTTNAPEQVLPFHPQSPAGKIWKDFNSHSISQLKSELKSQLKSQLMSQGQSLNLETFEWELPRKNTKGLGTSSAEFLVTWLLQSQLATHIEQKPISLEISWARIWNDYQALHQNAKLPPSGADLISQILGQCTQIDLQKKTAKASLWPFKNTGFLLYQTGFVLPTQAHLDDLDSVTKIPGISDLVGQSRKLLESFAAAQESLFWQQLQSFQKSLAQNRLELEQTSQLINFCQERFQACAKRNFEAPSDEIFFGAKGAGALGADGIVIWLPQKWKSWFREELERAYPKLSFVASDQELVQGMRFNFEIK